MGTYSRQVLAERAAVDTGFVDRLAELGILAPDADGHFTESDVRRVGVVQALGAGGLPLEAIGDGIRQGVTSLDFVDQSGYDRFASTGTETFRDVSARTGVPVDLLIVIHEAMGFAQPAPDDRIRTEELQVIPLVAMQLREGFRHTVIEGWLRVYGDSLRRIADTETDWYRSEILEPLFRTGAGVGAVVERTGSLDPEIGQFTDRAILGLYHGQQANAWMRNIMEGFETALARGPLLPRLGGAGRVSAGPSSWTRASSFPSVRARARQRWRSMHGMRLLTTPAYPRTAAAFVVSRSPTSSARTTASTPCWLKSNALAGGFRSPRNGHSGVDTSAPSLTWTGISGRSGHAPGSSRLPNRRLSSPADP